MGDVGIFYTNLELVGQGAQWPSMGAHLISSSEFFRKRIQDLEKSLASLPPADQPKWKLTEEILAGKETSRLSEAALSQPLCTAVQVALVDLLRTAGINFTTVVGHSSGEIAAAVRILLVFSRFFPPRQSQISRPFLMQ